MSLLNIAHRGASLDAPENTLQAFSLAVIQHADMIETDLHLTRDHVIALRHDPVLDGVEIGTLTLEDLRERAPTVPTLKDALDLLGQRIPFNLELKQPKDGQYEGLEAHVLEEVRTRGLIHGTLFSSFDPPTLARLRELDPEAHIGLLVSGQASDNIEARAQRVGAEAVHLPLSLATQDRIDPLQQAGFRVHVFTVDDPQDQRRLFNWNVDGLFTNTPAQLHALLGRSPAPQKAHQPR